MMRGLVERCGVDYDQWRALVRAGLKQDKRVSRGPARGGRRKQSNPLAMQLVFYFATGCVLAAAVATASDVFLSAVIVVTYAMFVSGVMVLLDYHTVVTAPDDYGILAYRPISSRTYFAARVTNLIVAVLLAGTAVALPCSFAVSMRASMRPEIGAGLLVGVWGAVVAVGLAVVLMYGWLVQRVPTKRLSHALTYLQLVMSFVVYGGYMLLPQFLGRAGMERMTLPKTALVLLYPPSWFASYTDIARGLVSWHEVLPAVAAIAAIVLLARAASGRISLEFAEKLASIAITAAPRSARDRAGGMAPSWLRAGEARAVWILLRNQFRSDQKFRMAVLGILPLTVLYMLMAIGKGGIPDPFVRARGNAMGGAALIYMAVMMFPVMLNTAITRSDDYKASWVFYATRADHEKTIVAVKNIVFVLFVLPYLAFTCLIFSFWFHNLVHAIVHTVMLALLSHLGLVLLMLFDPQMPFSRPIAKGERSARLFILSLLSAVLSILAIPLAASFVYISAVRTAALLGGLWLAGLVLEQLGRRRLRRAVISAEFMG